MRACNRVHPRQLPNTHTLSLSSLSSRLTPNQRSPSPLQINGDFWGTPQAIAHELGHNLFLGHASAYLPDGQLDE